MRALPEWIGKTNDAAIPPRVQERVALRSERLCVKCTRETGPALRGECDHAIPLIIGGQHRESNLQWLCVECHSSKTKRDVKLKSKMAKSRQREQGIRKTKHPIPGSRASGWRKRMDGTVERW